MIDRNTVQQLVRLELVSIALVALLGCGPTEAEREAKKLVTILVQGEQHLADGNPDLAIACFDRVIESTDYADAYLARGNAYHELGEPARALRDCETALRLQPEYVAAIYLRGLLHNELRDFRTALADFDLLLQTQSSVPDKMRPKVELILHNRGLSWYGLGEYEKAIHDFDAAITQDSESIRPYCSRSSAYAKLGDYGKAMSDAETALRLDPRHAEARYALGEVYAAREDFDVAIEHYQKALQLDPQDADTYNAIGTAKSRTGDTTAAIEAYSKAIELNPKVALYPVNRSGVYFDLGDFEGVIRDCDLAIAIDRNEYLAYLMRGRALQRLGREEEAQKDLNEARRLNPSWSEPPRKP